MNLLRSIFIYLIIKIEANKECSFDYALLDNQQVILTDFTRLDQLKFNCKKTINMSILTIHPTKKIILDSSLKFNKTKIISSQQFFTIDLKNFNGFDLSTNPFQDLNITNYDKHFVYWTIEDSMLNFMYKNISFSNNCNSKLMETYDWSNPYFNGYISLIEHSTKYTTSICPLVFRNSLVKTLLFEGISSCLINKNELEFLSYNVIDEDKLSSYIYHLNLGLYRSNLNKNMLNKHAFAFTVVIEINGIINSIQTDLFKDFKYLKLYTQGVVVENFWNIFFKNYNFEEIGDYKQNFENSSAHLFNALQIIRIILSDLIYIVLVFIIDLALLKFVTLQMRKKATITEIIDIQMSESRKLKLKRQKKSTQKRISSLIILNGINFLLFKLPSSLVNLYSFIFYFDKTNNIYKPNIFNYTICRYFNFCESVAELAHLFYLLSYLIQFFIFYKLDKNFHEYFLELILRLKEKRRPFLLETNRVPRLQVTRL
jgi:hypothetical protein